ncbi:MAG: thioredoxin [Alphaproteobacteria bacterium]|nr:thioredoxin [Alphaproteobacteria bacterium]MDE2266190.1 thioredoxin [Alphaproteobacteria bacterium]
MTLIGTSGRPLGQSGSQPAASTSPYVKDASLATFAADVLEASREVPVIVDFWAPWCGPCKQLGPALEKAVDEAKGAVRLVKVNIDENQEIARQLRIQSIPTVYAFKDGQPVDGFMGAIPDSQIKTFVQTLAGGGEHGGADHAAEVLAMADEAFASGDMGQAAQAYAHVLQDDPGHPKAVAGLAKCYLKSGDLERARNTLQLVRPDGAADEAVRAVEAELKLREQAANIGDAAGLQAKLAADPNNHQARYDLALALDAKGEREAALEALLEIVKRDRKWNDEGARKHLVTLFEAMGPTDPRTIAARRKLSSILFS